MDKYVIRINNIYSSFTGSPWYRHNYFITEFSLPSFPNPPSLLIWGLRLEPQEEERHHDEQQTSISSGSEDSWKQKQVEVREIPKEEQQKLLSEAGIGVNMSTSHEGSGHKGWPCHPLVPPMRAFKGVLVLEYKDTPTPYKSTSGLSWFKSAFLWFELWLIESRGWTYSHCIVSP